MIKNILIGIIMLLFLHSAYTQANEEIIWHSFEEATILNKENPKLIFIDVYTDWCGWCKKMDAATFKDKHIAKYMNEKYYCVKLNAETKDSIAFMGRVFTNPNPDGRRSTHHLAAILLQNKMSYPSYVFMNEDNRILTVVKGFVGAQKFDPIIHWFGERAYLDKTFPVYSKEFNAPK